MNKEAGFVIRLPDDGTRLEADTQVGMVPVDQGRGNYYGALLVK